MEKTQFWEDLKTGKFVTMVKESSRGQFLGSSTEAYNVLKPIFADQDDVEKMFFIFLNRKNLVLGIEKLFSGSITGSAVYPREVVKRVLALKATSIVMAHNHPSGDPQPSNEDLAITLMVYVSVHCVGVQLLDHVIIGNRYYSMADEGTIQKIKTKVEEFYRLNGGSYGL